ncbi:MAG: hypothetical protein JXQ65_02820 [Candidatus Marinimicrobia bacterium]|nr:hypothetical protein [Candidatus Neomarinimicrobiota bacterium]
MNGYFQHKDTLAHLFVEVYNHLQYDFINIGDNDLRLGIKKLQKLEAEANFDFISANIFYQGENSKHIFKPYKIIKTGNISLGFIGLASNPPVLLENLKVLDPIEAYKAIYKEIEDQCDYIIAVIALNAMDEYGFMASDIETDLIISANQYRYTRYLNNEKGKILLMTEHEGKNVYKITGHINDPAKPFGNVSYLQYSNMIHEKRLERYQSIAGEKTIEEHYKDQPRVIKSVNEIRQKQKEMENEIEQITNPLTLDVIEIELDTKLDKTIEKRMNHYKEIIKSLDK